MLKQRFCLEPEEAPAELITSLHQAEIPPNTKVCGLIRDISITPTRRSRPRVSFEKSSLHSVSYIAGSTPQTEILPTDVVFDPAEVIFWNFSEKLRICSLFDSGIPEDAPCCVDFFGEIDTGAHPRNEYSFRRTTVTPFFAFEPGVSASEVVDAACRRLKIEQSLKSNGHIAHRPQVSSSF